MEPHSGAGLPARPGIRPLRGRIGEDAAAAALAARGYRVLARNVRMGRGEIDLVCEHDGDVVFVEVKARRGAAFGTPAEAVTARKQRALVALASRYLVRTGRGDRPCRFDVVEVWLDAGNRPIRADVLRDAFQG
ncbi:MAG TPA: YraN family protein [bacterium]|nr:YraN family protein [bacterium]HEV2440332.1 YraN family protein [bacterium]